VLNRVSNLTYVESLVELSQTLIKKVPAIVGDNGSRDVKPVYFVLPNELLNLVSRDCSKRFCLNRLGKVVDSYKQKFNLTVSQTKGSQYIHAPNNERPRGNDNMEFLKL